MAVGPHSHNREDFVTYVMAAPGLVAKDGREETQKPDVGIYISDIQLSYAMIVIGISWEYHGDIMGISWRSFAKKRRKKVSWTRPKTRGPVEPP
jgi:hypothetical protein